MLQICLDFTCKYLLLKLPHLLNLRYVIALARTARNFFIKGKIQEQS